MADPHSSVTPSSSMVNPDDSRTVSSSSSGSQVQEEEYASGYPQFQSPDQEPQHLGITYRLVHWVFDHASSIVSSDTWSCIVVLFTFWSFVSVIMIMGVYGSMNLLLTPNSSMLIQPNPLFVQHIKVENLYESEPGIMLHGTYGSPSLDVVTTWTETCNLSIPTYSRKEWKYYLNRGSQVNISYYLSSKNSTITLVITEGDEGLTQWPNEPKYPNNTLSWNVVKGTGMVTQDIYRSSSYYVEVSNTNKEVEVKLNIRVRAFLYNTTDAYYKCALTSNPCGLNVFFPDGNAAILTSSGSQQNTSSDEWHIKLSYGPRWITYIFGICGMTWLMLLVFNTLDKCQHALADRAVQHGEPATQRAPLLSYKDDHLSSWGSSYESIPHDEEDLDFLIGGSTVEKSSGDGEISNNTRRLCAICFDAARDCFFLPCGHCVACFACGTRIAEAAGTCPVCRRNTKKVRKIFTV